MKNYPKFFKVFKRLTSNGGGGYWHCYLIRDDEVETYTVCATTLKTFGIPEKRTLQLMGWKSPQEFVKNRLKDYECIDIWKDGVLRRCLGND